MSKFAQLLEYYIQGRKINYTKLAERSGIDRTLIHHFVKDKRKPASIEVATKLAMALMLSRSETEELKEFCLMAQIGEDLYRQRKCVEDMLTQIHEPISREAVTNLSNLYTVSDGYYKDVQQVRMVLKQLIEYACRGTKKKLDLMIQPDNRYLMDILETEATGSSVQIRHIVCLDNGEESNQKNIHTLRGLLPTALGCRDYKVFYYYYLQGSLQNEMIPFPNLILTDDCVAMFRHDYSGVLIHRNPEMIQYAQEYVQECLGRCRPMIQGIANLMEQIQNYTPFLQNEESEKKVLALIPDFCCTAFLKRVHLEEFLSPQLPNRTALVELIAKYSQTVYQVLCTHHATMYLTKEGVIRYVQTGRFSECPDQFYQPLSREFCLDSIRQTLELCQCNPNFQVRLYDPNQLPIPSSISVTAGGIEGNVCINQKSSSGGFVTMSILEIGLTEILVDYLCSLQEHPGVFSAKESVQWLRNFLESESF